MLVRSLLNKIKGSKSKALPLLIGTVILTSECLAVDSNPGKLSLSTAISETVESSPVLRKSQVIAEASSWKKIQALSVYLPHLELRTNHYLTAKYSELGVNFGGAAATLPTAFPQTTVTVSTSITLFDGFEGWNLYRAASLESEAATLEASRQALQIEQVVRLRFFQTIAAQELVVVADQNLKTLKDHLKTAHNMVKTGYATRFDILRLEAQLDEAETERILALDNFSLARKELAETMGRENDERELEGALPPPDEKIVPLDLKLDVRQREDLKAQTSRQAAADYRDSASGRFWLPKVSLFAEDQYYKFGSFDPAILESNGFKNAYAVGLRLTWDMFDGGKSFGKSKEDAALARAAELTTREALLKTPGDFDRWKRRYHYNAVLFRARKAGVVKSEESVRLARLGLSAGTRTQSESLDAELELFRARAGVVKSQLDAMEALLRLELALGRKLANN